MCGLGFSLPIHAHHRCYADRFYKYRLCHLDELKQIGIFGIPKNSNSFELLSNSCSLRPSSISAVNPSDHALQPCVLQVKEVMALCNDGEQNVESDQFKTKFCGRRTCMKCCSTEAVVVVRMDDPLCRSCFLAYFTHKFRATIGKARAIRAGEKVLLAFSGGLSSSAMLHLVSEGLSPRSPRKLRFDPGIVFIDEGEILNSSKGERSQNVQQIRETTSKMEFPFHKLCLEDVFDIEKFRVDDSTCTKDNVAKLMSLFETTLSLTAKEDLVKTLRIRLLLETARKEGYSKVMLGDCATRLSIRLLSDISQGRGSDLPFDTGFSDERHGDVTFIRPMREFMMKEIALYNFFNRIESVSVRKLSSMTHSHASIDRLTEVFVSGLQADFPFTVSTIFRTGDKLSIKESTGDQSACALCEVPFEPCVTLHEDTGQCSSSVRDCRRDCHGKCSAATNQRMTEDTFFNALCFGCQLTFKDAKLNLDDLPAYAVEAANKNQHRAQMKVQIKDFLLEC